MGSYRFVSRAVALPGESIDWTAVLTVEVSDEDLTNKIIRSKKELSEAETHYLPLHIKEGSIQGAVLVCEGEVVEKVEKDVLTEPQAHSEEPLVHDSRAEMEVIEVGKQEQVLVDGVGEPSVDVVAEGDIQGGSADIGVEESVTEDSIASDIPRVKLTN